MSNPTINFRISPYQLARGLQIIRNLEPNYKITSISKIVKIIYFDYLAKMSINKESNVPQHLIDEVESLVYKKPQKIKFKEFITIEKSISNEKSIKSSVENFSPPTDWLE